MTDFIIESEDSCDRSGVKERGVYVVLVLHPPLAVRGFAATYLRVMATSIPPFILYQCLAGILRGLKDTFTIFRSSGVATVANIILDVLFVFGTPLPCHISDSTDALRFQLGCLWSSVGDVLVHLCLHWDDAPQGLDQWQS